MNRTGRKGFTLIELLVVVLIVGILAAVALPRFDRARDRSYVAAMSADLRNLSHRQEVYHADHDRYTTSLEDLEATRSPGVEVVIQEAHRSGWAATATHTALPGEQCGIYYGDADPANGEPAEQKAVVQCTF